jgi:hypothetical protein
MIIASHFSQLCVISRDSRKRNDGAWQAAPHVRLLHFWCGGYFIALAPAICRRLLLIDDENCHQPRRFAQSPLFLAALFLRTPLDPLGSRVRALRVGRALGGCWLPLFSHRRSSTSLSTCPDVLAQLSFSPLSSPAHRWSPLRLQGCWPSAWGARWAACYSRIYSFRRSPFLDAPAVPSSPTLLFSQHSR